MIKADHEQLRQVFLNLVLNSLDALPHGGVIQVAAFPERTHGAGVSPAQATAPDSEYSESRAHGTAKRRRGVTITVADNGPGISTEPADQVFEPYVSTKDSGLGLGLAVCRHIVEAHGGRTKSLRRSPAPSS